VSRIIGFILLALMLPIHGAAHADITDGSQFDGFLYVLGAIGDDAGPTDIEILGRERIGGKLDPIGRFLTGGQSGLFAGGQQHGLVRNGRVLYAVNVSSNTLSVLSIGSNGQLSLRQQVSSGGLRPVSMAIHGNRLYVDNTGHLPIDPPGPATIVGFTINPDGTLSPLPCEPASQTPGEAGNIVSDLAINSQGTALVTTGLLTNRIESYQIDAQGCLQKHQTVSAEGGAFGIAFRPNSDNAVINRALPEVFGDAKAPGVGSFQVGLDASFNEIDTYVDPDKSDQGLRDPCWNLFAKDGHHFWTGSFIPRAINAFNLDNRGKITRLSTHHPTDTVPDPRDPRASVVVGSFDLASDAAGTHLYQIRGVETAEGLANVPRSIHAYTVTGNFNVDAGLHEIQVVPLPQDTETAALPGLVFAERTTN
jgi:hypothetical protein